MSFVEEHQLGVKLHDASALLLARPDEVVSFKVRPIEDEGIWQDRYVYGQEYQRIEQVLAEYQRVGEGRVGPKIALLYELEDGQRFLYISHETGPEIIVLIKDILVVTGAAAVAGQQILKLINGILEIIRKEADAKNKGKKSGRYFGSKAISLEKRLSTGSKILKQIKVTADASSKALKSVQDLWGEK